MTAVFALQHTESEWLGLLEDHLEGRGIRFRYIRPFVDGAVPDGAAQAAALFLLGGGIWGGRSKPVLPSLSREVALARDFLAKGRPVIGFGLGAQVLCLAQGGDVEAAPLGVAVDTARRVAGDALAGHLPESWPLVTYMRDRPLPPPGARVLAVDSQGRPALFQCATGWGFAGHPGIKPAMIEDLVMEFAEAPDGVAEALQRMRALQGEIHASLSAIVAGLMKVAGLTSTPLPFGDTSKGQPIT